MRCKGSFGGCQGQPSARPWHLLKDPSGLQPSCPPHRFVSVRGYCLPYSLPYRPLPSTPYDSCSACLLPTVRPGNTPYTEPHKKKYKAKDLTLFNRKESPTKKQEK